MERNFEKLLETLSNNEINVIDKLSSIIDFIRPIDLKNIKTTQNSMQLIISFFQNNKTISTKISDEINKLLIDTKISTNIVSMGILSSNGFRSEIKERFYNKFMPKPPRKGDFRYIFATLFNKKSDYIWVDLIESKKWKDFFSSIFVNEKYSEKIKMHLFSELLYSAEILSIWIASKESDENFIRLDKTFLNNDSAFIALQRNISDFIQKMQKDFVQIDSIDYDFQHIQVLLEQCDNQIISLKKKSIKNGISVDLTYELERLSQIVQRLKDTLELIKKFDTSTFYFDFIELFKELVKKNSTRNSLFEIYQQNIRIVAKSITNSTSEHGEHYITDNLKQYIKMFLSSCGAGTIIAIMALIKINIIQLQLSHGLETILSSLNYGLGFVIIHLLGFTVATKQPAMTASTFAKAVEKGDQNKANQKMLVDLIFQVSRSQFAAVAGNVLFALIIAFIISYWFISNNQSILSSDEVEYYLKNLQPFPALFFAAIAGVWLFCSGIIAGYFDNRADLLELKDRYYYHPILKKILKDEKREKFAIYLHEHHGSIAGNFFFGVLLGITPYLGYLFDLPLDISHVAFSTAYLGYCSMHVDLTIKEFFLIFYFVLLIGFVNLTVSFILALKVSLLSRDTQFGNIFSFLKLLIIQACKKPHHLLFPFKKREKE